MPPFYDIYCLSRNRSSELIERVLNHFASREHIENIKGADIILEEYTAYGQKEQTIPVDTLTALISYGVKNSSASYTFYLGSHHLINPYKDLILTFTFDQKIIVGLSVECEAPDGRNNMHLALKAEAVLKELMESDKSYVQFECPPARDEAEFDEDMKEARKPESG